MSAKKRTSSWGKSAKRSKGPGGVMFTLSPIEQEALLRSNRLTPRVEQKVESAGYVVPRFTKHELSLILDVIANPSLLDTKTSLALLEPLRARIVETLEQDNPEAFGGEYLRGLDGAPSKEKLFFQFRVEILHTQPAVWRRIQLADDTLAFLHGAIQGAFDWEDDHLHEFEIGGLRFAPKQSDDFFDFGLPTHDEDEVKISQLLPPSGKQTVWFYTYDFGDTWRHEILFEGCGPRDPKMKYPVCLDGARAAPPENCGGPWGFAELLTMLAEPDADRDDEYFDDWLERFGKFDPEAFDAQKTTRNMRR